MPASSISPGTRPGPAGEAIDADGLMAEVEGRRSAEVAGYRGGAREAMRRLSRFIRDGLAEPYARARNEPTPYSTTELSAHLHFGQISPLTMALGGSSRGGLPRQQINVFLEELIVRRELAVNFVARNPVMTELAGCPEWARKTLAASCGRSEAGALLSRRSRGAPRRTTRSGTRRSRR